jgi:hypothetical protein
MRPPAGLSRAQLRAFEATLCESHLTRTRIEVLDQNEQVIRRYTPRVMGGQVDVDAEALPSRVADVELLDTSGRLEFVPTSAATAGAFVDNFLRVSLDTYVPSVGWCTTPLITGPITDVNRSGPSVSVKVDGKETLAMDPAVLWMGENAKVLQRGLKVTDAITRLLQAQGERRLAIPDLPRRLHDRITLDRMASPWAVARKLAASLDRQLFYDGAGFARLRTRPTDRVFAFRAGVVGGKKSNVLTQPEQSYGSDNIRNVIEALGPKPEGKGRMRKRFVAIANGPLSPGGLSRNGEPRWLVERMELENGKRLATVRDAARRELDARTTIETELAFTALVAPHLEELDRCALWWDGSWSNFTLRRFTIPLLGSDGMSVNVQRRVSMLRRRGGR